MGSLVWRGGCALTELVRGDRADCPRKRVFAESRGVGAGQANRGQGVPDRGNSGTEAWGLERARDTRTVGRVTVGPSLPVHLSPAPRGVAGCGELVQVTPRYFCWREGALARGDVPRCVVAMSVLVYCGSERRQVHLACLGGSGATWVPTSGDVLLG